MLLRRHLGAPLNYEARPRIQGRRILELVMDRRKSGDRDRARAFYTDVDIGTLTGRTGRARAEQKDAIGRIRQVPLDQLRRQIWRYSPGFVSLQSGDHLTPVLEQDDQRR